MRIYYHLGQYISHRLTGGEYVNCLRSLGHEVLTDPAGAVGADVAILHDEPTNYPAIFERIPALSSLRRIAYCVWEGSELTPGFIEPLRLVSEIWTPSHFSRQSLARHFPHVHVVPHVVRRAHVSADDLAFARSLCALPAQDGRGEGAAQGGEKNGVLPEDAPFCFLSIIDAVNPRKNVKILLGAFAALRGQTSRPLRLLLKQYRMRFDFPALPGLVSITGDLTPGQMGALHVLSGAYVSAHHAEGWGLGLSEAMAFGRPVIATGWSGNMEFMDRYNSLPIPYRLTPVSAAMCESIPLFTPDMLWADIDKQALLLAMKRATEGGIEPERLRRAATITLRFGPKQVAERMRDLLGKS